MGSAVVRGLLLKQVSAAALESPEVVANMGIKKIKAGVASGKLRPNFNKASVMRVGRNATKKTRQGYEPRPSLSYAWGETTLTDRSGPQVSEPTTPDSPLP